MAAKIVCATCGYIGAPQTRRRGSICVLFLLFLFFIVPGIIYLAWMLTSGYPVCPKCDGTNLIPPDSPVGKKLIAEQAAK